MLAAKGDSEFSCQHVRKRAFPRQNPHRQTIEHARAFAYLEHPSLKSPLDLCFAGASVPFTRGGAFLCLCASFGLLLPRDGRDGLRRNSPREGFGVRRNSPFILQLRILGLSDHRVQIACALLLRRARSIRSLPQDAIGRSVVDAFCGKQTRILMA